MKDIAQAGYIISAWCDIHIMANSEGVIVQLSKMASQADSPMEMLFDVVDGLAPIQEGVAKRVIKIPVPYAIFTKVGYSALVLPASMHSPFLDKLYVYPGLVDYEEFHTCNLIISPIKECEFVIPAGTPLLQVIPIRNSEKINAVSGKATEYEAARQHYAFASRIAGFYRRMFHRKKDWTIKIEDQE